MGIPEFVSIGHLTHDRIGKNKTSGGSALYSVRTASNLGLRSGIITSCSLPLLEPSILEGVTIHCRESSKTTTFENKYNQRGERHQVLEGVAETIEPYLIPIEWRKAGIINICPVAKELSPEMVQLFPNSTIGICPQGWMRDWDKQGQVFKVDWTDYELALPLATVIFFSQEDVDFPQKTVDSYRAHTMVVLTKGRGGATVYTQDREFSVTAFQATEIDPTGAGDVFAAAFLIKYHDTEDPVESATYANCVASFVVENKGMYGIPSAEAVEERLKNGPRYD